MLSPMVKNRRVSILNWYVLEGLNSFSISLAVYCIYFWTRHRFGYSESLNLLLGATMGSTCAVAAIVGGRLADRIDGERLLTVCFFGMLLFSGILGFATSPWLPFVLMALYNVFVGLSWPVMESALVHARSRLSMPDRLGVYNVVWATIAVASLFVGGWVFAWSASAILWIPAAVHGLQLVWLKIAVRRQETSGLTAMEIPHSGQAVPATVKQRFLRTAWLANALAYFMITAFLALAPYVGERLGLTPGRTIWMAAILFMSRALAFLLFWKWKGWHYNMRWSLLAMWMAPVAMAAIFVVPTLSVTIVVLILMGTAMGLTYSTSLYYSLDFGDNKGTQSGLHESILGIGIFCGPLAGAAGSIIFGGIDGAAWTVLGIASAVGIAGLGVIHRLTVRHHCAQRD